eukprot:scaffold31792_cov168-Amphora_coffeaeformis.AAC.2
MMVEPFFTRSAEDATKANGGNNDSGELFQSFDGLMDDLFDLSPSSAAGSSPPAAAASSSVATAEDHTTDAFEDSWRFLNPSNAVHMHVQENSKLPSINFSVDRNKHSRSPEFDGDASKLAESFLCSSRRQSYHANYEQAGALSQTTGTSFNAGHHTRIQERRDSLDADVLEAFLADIDPTPLSEIKKRHASHHSKSQQQQQQKALEKQPLAQFYTRKAMLPIPTKKISPPVSPGTKKRQVIDPSVPKQPTEPMQSAVATAAALAAARPKAPAQNNNPTPVSIHQAFEKRSRYGFGTNHVVPSVPAPPQHKPMTVSSSGTSGNNNMGANPKNISPPPGSSSQEMGQGDAYERKKQRAKDARIKLNESIERLSVAIALAGTQSRERRQQWQELGDSPFQDTCMQIMGDCIDTADSAKKWDRPSFVGSAASLVQGLNAQCEAMMREIMRLREDEARLVPPAVVSTESRVVTAPPSPPPPTHKRPLASTSPVAGGKNDEGSPAKRAKVEFTVNNPIPVTVVNSDDSMQAVWANPKLANKIVGFLDPLSLLLCQRVSRAMRGAANRDDTWEHLCAERFGFFNVRQWRAKLDDEEEGIKAQFSALYRSMDRSNVMGSFQHEGLFLLGEARLPNKVSAWVFLVERSNGETMRSVRRRNDMPGNGTYTTLPIVELRTVVQNTGIVNEAVIIREQIQAVDASTRRRGEELKEVDWDDRFRKRASNLDGKSYKSPEQTTIAGLARPAEICRLRLFESVVLTTFIHAKGCSTNSKFVQRANFTKILVALESGVTVPLVVPFPRDASHLQH